jgi:hypothetical protein
VAEVIAFAIPTVFMVIICLICLSGIIDELF